MLAHLTVWMPAIVALIAGLAGPWLIERMRSQGLQQQGRRDDLKTLQGDLDRLERRHTALRELFERLKHECLRALETALVRLESEQHERVLQLLEALKKRIESFALPPLEDE